MNEEMSILEFYEKIEQFKSEGKIKQIIYILQPYKLEQLHDVRLYVEVANAHLFIGQIQLCIARCNEALMLAPFDVNALFCKEQALRQLRKSPTALADIQKLGNEQIEDYNPEVDALRYNLSLAEKQYVQKSYLNAIQQLKLVEQIRWDDAYKRLAANSYLLLIDYFRNGNKITETLAAINDFCNLFPDDYLPVFKKAEFYEATDEYKNAIVNYQICLEYENIPSDISENLKYKIKLYADDLKDKYNSSDAKRNALIIEPDELARFFYVRTLRDHCRFNVKMTTNMDLAYLYLKTVKPQLILTHNHLEHFKYDEYLKIQEMLRWVKMELPDTLVILTVTGGAFPISEQKKYYYHFLNPRDIPQMVNGHFN